MVFGDQLSAMLVLLWGQKSVLKNLVNYPGSIMPSSIIRRSKMPAPCLINKAIIKYTFRASLMLGTFSILLRFKAGKIARLQKKTNMQKKYSKLILKIVLSKKPQKKFQGSSLFVTFVTLKQNPSPSFDFNNYFNR